MSLMDTLKEKAFQLALHWNSRPNVVRRLVRDMGFEHTDNLRLIKFNHISVAAVQVQVRPAASPEDFVRQLCPLVAEAARRGAQLVVLPEDISLGLFGMLPGFEDLRGEGIGDALNQLGEGVTLENVLRFVGPAMVRTYRATFSELSRTLGVYIAAGSTMLPTRQGICNVSHLYGPDGKLVGTDAKTHLQPLERDLGISRGRSVRVYETRIGHLAAPVCMDASFFEPIRMLVLKGAEIIALPVANNESYNFWRALRGLWPRVQESPAYGVKACLVGEFLGMTFTGKSAVYAPIPLTTGADGVVAEVEHADRPGIALADVDLVALRRFRKDSGFYENLSPTLYRKYLPWSYTNEDPPPEAWLHDAPIEELHTELIVD